MIGSYALCYTHHYGPWLFQVGAWRFLFLAAQNQNSPLNHQVCCARNFGGASHSIDDNACEYSLEPRALSCRAPSLLTFPSLSRVSALTFFPFRCRFRASIRYSRVQLFRRVRDSEACECASYLFATRLDSQFFHLRWLRQFDNFELFWLTRMRKCAPYLFATRQDHQGVTPPSYYIVW